MCRTVDDIATVLEVLTGDDPRDVITAVAHGRPPIAHSNYAGRHSLAGKRLGVVRDFMIEATIADRENIRIGNEALTDMKSLGATLVDPVDFSGAIAEIMTAYEPSFFHPDLPARNSRRGKADRPFGSDRQRPEAAAGRCARRQSAHACGPEPAH